MYRSKVGPNDYGKAQGSSVTPFLLDTHFVTLVNYIPVLYCGLGYSEYYKINKLLNEFSEQNIREFYRKH